MINYTVYVRHNAVRQVESVSCGKIDFSRALTQEEFRFKDYAI